MADFLGDVPGDCLSLAVRIRRKENLIGLGGGLFQFGDDLFLLVENGVGRLEGFSQINAERVFRKVFDMADRGLDLVILSEVFAERFDFRRRFDDNQCIQFMAPLVKTVCRAGV